MIANSTKGGATGVFANVTKWSVYLLFFLTPLFFLPWTSSVLELNKQLLLVVLTIVGLTAWLGQMVLTKRLTFRSGWLNVVPALFLVAVLVSSLTSFAGYQSWVGQASQEYTSFLSIAMFVSLFYLLMNNAGSMEMQKGILKGLLLSATISGLLLVLGMLGVFHLPFDFAASKGFNTVGTVNGFITFGTTVMFLGLAMWLTSQEGRDRVIPVGTEGMVWRGLIVAVTLITLFAQVAIDFWVFWIVNVVGVLLLAVFAFIQSQEFPHPKRFAIPLVVLLISIVFLFIDTPLKLSLPIVVSPSYGTSFNIATSALGHNKLNFLFGSGPGTYMHDYLAFKPAAVNNSQFWTLRFDRAKSAAITTLATLGVVGFLLWLTLMVWLAVKALGRLTRERDHEEWKMTYVVFIGWVITFVSYLLYSSNITLDILFWGLSGLLASQIATKMWSTDFSRSPRLGLLTSFTFVVVGVGFIASLFFTGQRYAAEVAFSKAIQADAKSAPTAQVIANLQKAVKYNGLSDVYLRNLASAQLAQARETITSFGGKELTPEQTQQIADQVGAAIKSAEKASSIEPNYVANWVVRGTIYRDVMSFAQGAEDLAAQMFLNAIRIEPNNPVHRTNLGRVYLAVADRARGLKTAEDKDLAKTAVDQETTLLKTAEQAFTSAIQLKSDYSPAHYYLAAVYERQGRLQESAARLLAVRNNNPTDIGIGFQLSSMLIRLQRYDLAEQELTRLVKLNDKFSNGLWFLASMYELSKKQDEAIKLVERVVELNPENKVARERLKRMRAGEITTTVPEPIQPGQESVTQPAGGEIVEEAPVEEEEAEEETSTEETQ